MGIPKLKLKRLQRLLERTQMRHKTAHLITIFIMHSVTAMAAMIILAT
jgi:hypothetical protein